MKKLTGFSILAGALLLIAAAQPALAICANARIVASVNPNAGNASYIYTPGLCDGGYPCSALYSTTTGLTGAFWALGYGQTPIGQGTDNGSWTTVGGYPDYYPMYYGWVRGYQTYPVAVNTTWAADPGIDGCIETDVAGNKCTLVLLNDQVGSDGFFALVSRVRDGIGNYFIDQPNNAPIVLGPLPRPGIQGTNRIDDFNLEVTVGPPSDIAGSLYLDPACGLEVTGYRIYSRNQPRGGADPDDRDRNQFVDLSGSPVDLSSSTTVPASCSGDEDIYLTYSIEFDSGFELVFLSQSSGRVECGENLADPGDRPVQFDLPDDIRSRGREDSGRKGRGR